MQTTGAALLAVKRCSLARVLTPAQDSLSRRTFELTEQGQVTDRFTKAIEQLGSDKLDVRLGGIYALERVARDSAKDHPTVMEVLTAFIREHPREEWLTSEGGQPTQEGSTRPDIQAAVTVVGRRDTEHDILRIDLAAADLTHAILTFAVLTRADLTAAVLAGRTSPLCNSTARTSPARTSTARTSPTRSCAACASAACASEVCGMYVEDLDLRPDDEHARVHGKGGTVRTVLLDDRGYVALLKLYLARSGYTSGPLSYDAAHNRWKKYCAAAGTAIGIHQLRHAHATELKAASPSRSCAAAWATPPPRPPRSTPCSPTRSPTPRSAPPAANARPDADDRPAGPVTQAARNQRAGEPQRCALPRSRMTGP